VTGTFVSIGNGTQSFARLLDEVKRIAPQLPQPVVVQHGWTPFFSDSITNFDFTDEPKFVDLLQSSTLFITHGGGGSVFAAIRMGKRAVVVPRRKLHREVTDDHQLFFVEELARQQKIEPVLDVADLWPATQRALSNPSLSVEINDRLDGIEAVRLAVASLVTDPADKILLVTPSGGHLAEMRSLSPCYSARPHHFVINTPIILDDRMVGRTSILTLSRRDLKFFVNMKEAWDILRRERPRVILTTGGGFSVAFALVAKMLGVPIVYVETVAKVVIPTVTGRVMYRLADRFFYQWPYLEKFFPKGRFIGLIL
jgi:beta-1,4-N-acetylglucosaminyltransferase